MKKENEDYRIHLTENQITWIIIICGILYLALIFFGNDYSEFDLYDTW